ncbi:hypothetical protein [Streptomyces griseomycini]|uniref:Uncharacterized protein n=1 Tax=Streptomyces griseomycini TaxID=66895 RepID=A0A7W7PUI5_9ACTN|nr:hypothetical protein [Streptomyces griseomycini]MBB4901493.1 hypothetical protein [Streptomyces griseomycini]GGQ15086.1 hypothetical protein GCM10010266_43050 [Streptomyces griseomycini]GGR25151.1 hypothetical protein GCM10015536_33700 [Streptomyces griseomycini]
MRATKAAPRSEQPWSAGAEVRVGDALLVVHAREAGVRELADRLRDRLRSQVERVVQDARTVRSVGAAQGRTALAWGGPAPFR